MTIEEKVGMFLEELLEPVNEWAEKLCFRVRPRLEWEDRIEYLIVIQPDLSAETFGVFLTKNNAYTAILRGVVIAIVSIIRKVTNYKLRPRTNYEIDETVDVVMDDGKMLTLVPEVNEDEVRVRTQIRDKTNIFYDNSVNPQEAMRWLIRIIELYKEAIEDDSD